MSVLLIPVPSVQFGSVNSVFGRPSLLSSIRSSTTPESSSRVPKAHPEGEACIPRRRPGQAAVQPYSKRRATALHFRSSLRAPPSPSPVPSLLTSSVLVHTATYFYVSMRFYPKLGQIYTSGMFPYFPVSQYQHLIRSLPLFGRTY